MLWSNVGIVPLLFLPARRLQSQAEAEGSEHFKCDIGNKSLLILRSVYKFREFLKELQPDIVHARSRLPAWSALLAMSHLEHKPKFITSVHGLNSPGFYSGVMLRVAKKLSACQKRLKSTCFIIGRIPINNKIVVLTPGIDPKEFSAEPANRVKQWRHDFLEQYPRLQVRKNIAVARSCDPSERPRFCLESPGRPAKRNGRCTTLLSRCELEPGRERYLRRTDDSRLGASGHSRCCRIHPFDQGCRQGLYIE